jgi:protein tyrosine/serine phosphatase
MNPNPGTKPILKRLAKRISFVVLSLVLAVGGYVLYLLVTDNFHVVVAGQVYRSGQMSGSALARVIHAHGIQSVLNLRGGGGADGWYRDETNTTHQLGVGHYDFALSAGREVSDEEIEDIMATLRQAPKPVLIHCNGGADRSALISAIYLYTTQGETAAEASRALSPFYGHIPHLHWRYAIAMDRSYWRYVSNHTANAELKIQTAPAVP